MRKNVAVSLERPGLKPGDKVKIIFRCYRIRSAELFIERRMKRDPEGVARGDYGVDAPERLTNRARTPERLTRGSSQTS